MSFTDKSQYTEANLKKSYRNCDYFCDEAIIYQIWPQDTMYSANPSNFYLSTLFLILSYINSQCPEINSNKILNNIHKNYIGLTSILQGFQKCIA